MAWFKISQTPRMMDDMADTDDGTPIHERFAALGEVMPAWRQTPIATRNVLLKYLVYQSSVVPRSMVPGVEPLVAVKLLDAEWKKSEIHVGKSYGPVWETLQTLQFSEYFHGGVDIRQRLPRMFPAGWLTQMAPKSNNGLLYQDVEFSIRSRTWIRGFLAAPDKTAWMRAMQLRGPLHSPMDKGKVFGQVQRLVKMCLEECNPLPVALAENRVEFGGRSEFYHLLGLAAEHLLLLPVLDRQTLDLMVMIEPEAYESLRRPPAARPAAVAAVAETFSYPWTVEDIIVILTHAALKPLRMRMDGEIYAHDLTELNAALAPLPEWVLSALGRHGAINAALIHTGRADSAIQLARQMNLLGTARDQSWNELEPTGHGQKFLALAPGQRIQQMAEAMIASQELNSLGAEMPFVNPFGGLPTLRSRKSPLGNLRPLIARAVDQYPAESFIPAEQFLFYHAAEDNPYIAAAKDESVVRELSYKIGRLRTPAALPEQWENLWVTDLMRALFWHVAGLGGVTFGCADGGGGAVFIQVNAVGRYLLGLAQEFVCAQAQNTAEKPLLVQPNFEVVFVTASPATHVLCGQFCDRSGRGSVGNLLKITKKSIIHAARAGWTAERVVETMANASSKPLPGNVLHEIRGWFAGLRQVQAHHCVLVTCPDEATANRVRSLYAQADAKARILPGNLVELSGSLSIRDVTRKLDTAGIFVT